VANKCNDELLDFAAFLPIDDLDIEKGRVLHFLLEQAVAVKAQAGEVVGPASEFLNGKGGCHGGSS
jgi:hypothetical protein